MALYFSLTCPGFVISAALGGDSAVYEMINRRLAGNLTHAVAAADSASCHSQVLFRILLN